MRKNDIITIKITDLNSDGAGVGRVNGEVVFVPYALPDELVEALIIKCAKNYSVGKLLNVLEPSKCRTDAPCPYFYKCGGCDFQHLNYNEQLRLKCETALKNTNKLSGKNFESYCVIGAENIFNYRNKAQFPISTDKSGVVVGFFSSHSHRVVPIESCMLQTNECNSVIPAIKIALKKVNVSIYDEEKHVGVLRHIIARSGKHGLMLILVTNSAKRLPDELIRALKEALPSLTTIIQNINTKKGNIILGSECITLFGNGFVEDEMCGINFKLRPLAFLQVNSHQAEKLYNKVLEIADLSGNEIVFDAYCGIGIMSLMLAQKAKKLIGVEIVPEAITTAKETATSNNISNAEFFVGACENVLPDLLKKGEKPDVLVVDPPRAGCEESLLKAISQADIKKIVYVSCNPATLARDIKFLAQEGYSASKLTFVDMFCHTKHIETIVCLTRE